MIKKLESHGVTWCQLESPTEEELQSVANEYGLHPVAVRELASPSLRSKVDVYQNFIYLILHFPNCRTCRVDQANGKKQTVATLSDEQEIDFILGRDFLITAHYEPIDSLLEFGKIFELGTWLPGNHEKTHAGFLFFYLFRALYQALANNLDYINQRLKQIERSIFSSQEKAMVKLLAEINRELLDFRWALKAHKELLLSLSAIGHDFFGSDFHYYLSAIVGEYEKIWNMVESNRATFLDLRETNDSLLSVKNNETMKFLSVVAFIFLPMTMIIQLFGMNAAAVPIVGRPNDFYIIMMIAAVLTLMMFAAAKFRRWF